MTKRFQTQPWRDDTAAHLCLDKGGHLRETLLRVEVAKLISLKEMKTKRNADKNDKRDDKPARIKM